MENSVILLDKYRIIQEIKSTKASQIYLTQHISLKSLWIIKRIHSQDPSFENELNILKRLNHPCIPLTVDVIVEGEINYIVREYVDGLTLEEHIIQVGLLNEQETLKIGVQLCNVLSYLHRAFEKPIIYRDMKPSNIIILKDGSIKLIDFSIARYFDQQKDKDTCFLGTKGFAAPEQYGFSQSDVQTDIFGVGATLHYCLTQNDLGKAPYRLKPIRDFRQDIDRETEKILIKATSMNKEERFLDSEELKAELLKSLNKKEEDQMMILQELKGKKIGFCSLKKGLGATYQAFAFAKELVRNKKSVLLLDCSESEELLEVEYQEGADYVKNILVFQEIPIITWKGFLKGIQKGRNEKFIDTEYFLFDFGNQGSNNFGNAFRLMKNYLDQYLVLSSISPWNQSRFDEFIMKENTPKENLVVVGCDIASYERLVESLCGLSMFRYVYATSEVEASNFVREVLRRWDWELDSSEKKERIKINWLQSGKGKRFK